MDSANVSYRSTVKVQMNEIEEKGTDDVNIEEIMQEIRRQILSKKRIGKPPLPASGRHFSPEFYEQLYQAALLQGELGIKLFVSRSEVPLFGSLIDKLRGKVHELVLYYVNQAVAQQAEINDHILQALTLLSQELEEDAAKIDANQ